LAREALAYLASHPEAADLVATWGEVRSAHGTPKDTFHDRIVLYESWSEASGVSTALVFHHAPALQRLGLTPEDGEVEEEVQAYLVASALRRAGARRGRRGGRR
jgi:hypothetical protein